ncbi:MAG: transglutaminaseTgpA domain-containing protein [Clostridia bacterium]|nr:transglutaminaseTgpA domain-containing protein [Clostridia bacterium]
MLTRTNWLVIVLILVITNYWSSLAWLATGMSFSSATAVLSLVILLATAVSVLGFHKYLPLKPGIVWICTLLGLVIAIGLGMLVAGNSRVELIYLLPSGYMLVLLLTPLLLSDKFFWVILHAGMSGMAYAYPADANSGYAVHYLMSGLIIAAIRPGELKQDREAPGSLLPGWQKIVWPVVFASFLVGSVVTVHSFLPVPGGELRDMAIKQVRNWLSLSTVPTYEVMQNLEAGGTITPSGLLFMQVASPYPDYWRGQSFDLYTGTGWQKKMDPAARVSEEDYVFNSARAKPGSGVVQKFTFAKGVSSNIGFSGYLTKALAVEDKEYLVEPLGDVVIPHMIKPGESYRVLVEKPAWTPGQLRKAGAEDGSGPIWPQTYLELPEKLPVRIKATTREIVRGLSNRYEQVKAVESYLRTNYPYTQELEKPPPGRDMVDYFLFTARKGYCTYHASAMAVMLRSLGIPTRLVIGFTTGDWQEQEGVYEVRDRDAHAWVEVLFPTVGWVPFEPTASFRLPGEPVENVSLPTEKSVTQGLNTFLDAAGWGTTALLSWLVFSLVILIGLRIQKASAQEKVSPITAIYRELLMFLAGKGHPKEVRQTPLEYIRGLKQDLGDNYPVAESIVMAYLSEVYGGKQLSAELIAKLRAGLTVFKKSKPRQRAS